MHAHWLGVGRRHRAVKVEVAASIKATQFSAHGIIILIYVPIIAGVKGKAIAERVRLQDGLFVAALGGCANVGSDRQLLSSPGSDAYRAPEERSAPLRVKATVCELVSGRR